MSHPTHLMSHLGYQQAGVLKLAQKALFRSINTVLSKLDFLAVRLLWVCDSSSIMVPTCYWSRRDIMHFTTLVDNNYHLRSAVYYRYNAIEN